jgi:hypothetical protein
MRAAGLDVMAKAGCNRQQNDEKQRRPNVYEHDPDSNSMVKQNFDLPLFHPGRAGEGATIIRPLPSRRNCESAGSWRPAAIGTPLLHLSREEYLRTIDSTRRFY